MLNTRNRNLNHFQVPQLLLVLISCLLSAQKVEPNSWSDIRTPSSGPSFAIGDTSAGCLRGAEELPIEGEGYSVMHLERHRYFGHPKLINAAQRLGKAIAEDLGLIHIGDLGMARGGPMPFGHRSHQTGLDVDIWFDLNPSLPQGTNKLRSNIDAPSFLLKGSRELDYSLWSNRQVQMLKLAVSNPDVDRIFVNARIKQELCDSANGNRDWLHKIRPWYFHDDHFHMRLACPPDSKSCIRQAPIPIGDGCDLSLDEWANKGPLKPSKKPPPPPNPILPAECSSVLMDD